MACSLSPWYSTKRSLSRYSTKRSKKEKSLYRVSTLVRLLLRDVSLNLYRASIGLKLEGHLVEGQEDEVLSPQKAGGLLRLNMHLVF